jgi:hypothetical protein
MIHFPQDVALGDHFMDPSFHFLRQAQDRQDDERGYFIVLEQCEINQKGRCSASP